MMRPRGLPDACRANFTAFSFASAPPSVKNTAAAGESRFLEQQLGELRARLRAPRAGDEAQLLRLLADRGDDLRMLMTEIAALGEAAHVQDGTAVGGVNPRARAPHNSRGGPVGLSAPAVQDGIAFGKHAGL